MENKQEYTEEQKEQIARMVRIFRTCGDLSRELDEVSLPHVTPVIIFLWCQKLTRLTCDIREHFPEIAENCFPGREMYGDRLCPDDDSLKDHNLKVAVNPLAVWVKMLDKIVGSGRQQFILDVLETTDGGNNFQQTEEQVQIWRTKVEDRICNFFAQSRFVVDSIEEVFYEELADLNFAQFPNVAFAIIGRKMHNFKEVFFDTYNAIGPYTPDAEQESKWQPPSDTHLDGLGILETTLLRREDGRYTVRCVFSSPKGTKVEWEVNFQEDLIDSSESLKKYERFLFATWSYSTGEHLVCEIPDKKAYWFPCNVSNMRGLSETADFLAETALRLLIHENQAYKDLARRILAVVRNNQPVWWPGKVQWSYVKELDEVIRDIQFAAQLHDLEHPLEVTSNDFRESYAEVEAEIADRFEAAWRSYEIAEKHLAGDGPLTDRKAYDWLEGAGAELPSQYELPAFGTWQRYVRKARLHYGQHKNQKRAGRSGKSIVKQADV